MDWRNPFENFRDRFLSFRNVRAYKLYVYRYRYIPYSVARIGEYINEVNKAWEGVEGINRGYFYAAYRDMGVEKGVQDWITKFFNAKLALHIGVSVWRGWLPLPFIGIVYRIDDYRYFQCGGFFGPEGAYDPETKMYERATLCGKFRFAEFKQEYYAGGNYDPLGYWEGAV